MVYSYVSCHKKKILIRDINIQLIEKIKKPAEGNKFLSGLLTVLVIVLFPLIIVIGLIFMLVMWTWSFLKFGNPSKTELQEKQPFEEQWTVLTSINDLKIEQKFIDEIRYGPAYFELKSEPNIQSLKNKTFGDWFYRHKTGVLLQQWNSTASPDTNLMFIDAETLETRNIKENIPSVLWTLTETEDEALQLNCDTGREILTYKIEI